VAGRPFAATRRAGRRDLNGARRREERAPAFDHELSA
jgi:hypothetical protein